MSTPHAHSCTVIKEFTEEASKYNFDPLKTEKWILTEAIHLLLKLVEAKKLSDTY